MEAALQIPSVMSVREFLSWNAPAGTRWQLIDGMPTAMAPTSRTHGAIQSNLARDIGNHLAAGGGPCSVISAPGIVPRIRSSENFRIPDLAVTCTPYQAEEYDLSDPVLIIEILSPSNKAETWANIWAYATIPSVREILIVHSTAILAEVLRRDAEGHWPDRPERIEEGDLTLSSIGFQAPIASVYATTRLALP